MHAYACTNMSTSFWHTNVGQANMHAHTDAQTHTHRMKAEEFSKEIVPGVVRCFKSTDRATRLGLLQNMHTFAEHLTPALVEKDIFPSLSTGFTDTVPALRELTVKSLVHLVPKLSERIINSQVLRPPARLHIERCSLTQILKFTLSLTGAAGSGAVAAGP